MVEGMPASSSPAVSAAVPAATLKRVVSSTDDNMAERELRLLFLGCESQPPYGPYEHTATLFLDLIERSLKEMGAPSYHVVLDVYHVSQNQFPPPDVYGSYDGVILPGSFSAAYDTEPWILELCRVVQEELVPKQRPTLGVCFGHQIYAHSFPDGGAIKCPAGPQAGRKVADLTPYGRKWLQGNQTDDVALETSTGKLMDDLQLYYSHGDMVERLPAQALPLGGNQDVPILAAIYFSAEDNVEQRKPCAVTFQAHPEYASSKKLGLQGTLSPILDAMQGRNDISSDERKRAGDDALQQYDAVEQQSIQTMITAGRLLGWFPAA